MMLLGTSRRSREPIIKIGGKLTYFIKFICFISMKTFMTSLVEPLVRSRLN